jgi:hypothetical protein
METIFFFISFSGIVYVQIWIAACFGKNVTGWTLLLMILAYVMYLFLPSSTAVVFRTAITGRSARTRMALAYRSAFTFTATTNAPTVAGTGLLLLLMMSGPTGTLSSILASTSTLARTGVSALAFALMAARILGAASTAMSLSSTLLTLHYTQY